MYGHEAPVPVTIENLLHFHSIETIYRPQPSPAVLEPLARLPDDLDGGGGRRGHGGRGQLERTSGKSDTQI